VILVSLHGLHGLLNLGLAVVELVLDLLWNFLQELLREDAQQGPGDVQGRENIAILVRALRQEPRLELVGEFEVLVLILAQSLLADNRLHGASVLTDGVVGVELIRHVWVVHARHALADTRFHQAAQRREHIDGRVDLPVVQRAIDKHLALSNVAGQVWDRVRDVIIWHRENWELSDGACTTLHTSSTLVDGGEIGVHVTWVTTAAWHLFSGGGDLAQGVCIGGHVGKNHKDVLLTCVCEILCCGQRQARGNNALDGRVVRKIHEKDHILHGTVFLEVILEEAGGLHVNTHGTKNDTEIFRRVIFRIFTLHQ